MKKKVLISTGGSGGHVVPAITIYNHLKHTHETFISTDIRGLAYLEKNYKAFGINKILSSNIDKDGVSSI